MRPEHPCFYALDVYKYSDHAGPDMHVRDCDTLPCCCNQHNWFECRWGAMSKHYAPYVDEQWDAMTRRVCTGYNMPGIKHVVEGSTIGVINSLACKPSCANCSKRHVCTSNRPSGPDGNKCETEHDCRSCNWLSGEAIAKNNSSNVSAWVTAIPSRFTPVCVSCPAWFSCKDHEGLVYTCLECNKLFYMNTQKRNNYEYHAIFGTLCTEVWRFIEGISADCPFLVDEFIKYQQPCVACMRLAGVKVVEEKKKRKTNNR